MIAPGFFGKPFPGDWREIDHFIDVSFGITPLLPRKADQFPADHISVAAIARLTENALQHVGAKQLKERLAVAQLGYFPRFKIAQRRILLLAAKFFEGCAELPLGVFIQGPQSSRVSRQQMRIGTRERAVNVKDRPCFNGTGSIGGR